MKSPPGTIDDLAECVAEARPWTAQSILDRGTSQRAVVSLPDVSSEQGVNAEGDQTKKMIDTDG